MSIIPSDFLAMPRFAGVRVTGVYLSAIVCYAVAILFWLIRHRMTQSGSSIPSGALIILIDISILLVLSWGCLRLNKLAYCFSLVLITGQALAFLKALPDELIFLRDTASWLIKSGETVGFGTSGFYAIGFYYMAFAACALKAIALVVLLLPTTIKAFFLRKHTLQT